MADLFSLLQDLGDRIASKSDSGSIQLTEDDPVESRFRTVLPTLLEAYFMPDKVKEREILAILRLLSHMVEHFPGVLFHGKAHSVLPVIGRILPLFAEPAASGCYDCLFDTLRDLISLFRRGDIRAFRKFFVDATILVEDLVSIGSCTSQNSFPSSTTITVQCFKTIYAEVYKGASCGLSIDVTGKSRWESFAEAIVKSIGHCLADEHYHVEGLITSSFVIAAGRILSYGTSSLHKACFELVRVATSTVNASIIPSEKVILSILCILSDQELPSYRTSAYDTILGSCLLALYTTSACGIVECTADLFYDIFVKTIVTTSSRDLKVCLCSIMSLIVRQCPLYSTRVLLLQELLMIPDIIAPFSHCIQVSIDVAGLDLLEILDPTGHNDEEVAELQNVKRRKLNDTSSVTGENRKVISANEHGSSDLRRKVLNMIESVNLALLESEKTTLDGLLSGYCILARSFGQHPQAAYCSCLLKQFCDSLPWFKTKGRDGVLTNFQVSVLLEVIDTMLFPSGCQRDHNMVSTDWEAVTEILKLPWSDVNGTQTDSTRRAKSQALLLATKIKTVGESEIDELVECGIKDEDFRVRSTAITVVTLLVLNSDLQRMSKLQEKLWCLLEDESELVRETLAKSVGQISCIYSEKVHSSSEPLVLNSQNGGLSCMVCDKRSALTSQILKRDDSQVSVWSFQQHWELLIRKFLFEDVSVRVQLAFIGNLSRFIVHASESDLIKLKDVWLRCLDFFPLHQDRGVREAFSSQICYFLEEHVLHGILGGMGSNPPELEILAKLRQALLLASNDSEVQETLMVTVAEIAKAAKSEQLRIFSVVVLIEQLDNRNIGVRVLGVRLINDVAEVGWPSHGTQSVKVMVDSIQKGLFEFLCGRLLTRPLIIKEFARSVMKIEVKDLLTQMVPAVLPKLILEHQKAGMALDTLNELARQLETTLPLLMLEWCHKVLSVLLLRADGKELMAALQFYESQTGSDPREIFEAVLPALLDELVRFLGDVDNEEAFKRSARVGPMIQEVASIVTGSDDLAGFLKNHFIGLLNSIDRKLLRGNDLSSQRQALRCIERLVEMIGSHLSAFVPKIMALLTQAVQEENLQHEGLIVWCSFVKRLAQVSPTNLRSVASQVVVALMPCLESNQASVIEGVVGILEELIVKNKNIIDDQARELPLLPSIPALASVNAILHKARGSYSLRDELRRAVDGLGHESLSLRYVTATELLKLLSLKRSEVTALLLGETPSDADTASGLVSALLRGCAEESRTSVSQKFKLVCAECLGALGAIDPVKLQVSLRCRSRVERSDEDLVFELINEHLTRVLRAASDTDVQDAAALAIQELLKFSGCHEAVSGRGTQLTNRMKENKSFHARTPSTSVSSIDSGQRLWNRFSEDVKEIITPCLTSKYLLKLSTTAASSGPIFRQGVSFRRWMYLWTRKLLTQVTGRRSAIFTACKGVIRHDMDTALYLLPYIILDVVCNGSPEARASVTEEILAVLSEAGNEAGNTRSGQPAFLNNTYSWSGLGEVTIQTIFTLLDNLEQWMDEYKQRAAVTSSLPTPKKRRSSPNPQMQEDAARGSKQCEYISQLLAAIPKQALAGASFRCHAHARALLYYESYVREKSGSLNLAAETSGTFEDADIAFLLKIYGGLDEPDGLLGLARLQRGSSLQDQVLIHEKSGNWAEALTFCEQALQMEPNSLLWQSGFLDCLINMGHLQSMVTHVDGLIARMPSYKKEWSMRGVQAAWRLGQWDLLDEFIQGAESEASSSYSGESHAKFDLSLGKILQAVRTKDHFKLSEHLMHSRLSLLAPLTAASMESYTRAYPLIVKLHMLRELEEFFAVVSPEVGDMSSLSLEKLVDDWHIRLKVTQPSLWTREPILALRRLLFSASNMLSEVSTCWLQYAKLCRSSGHYETAGRAILQAQSAGAPNVHVETAKLLWDTKKTHRAIDELQQALAKVPLRVLGSATNAALGGLLNNPLHSSSSRSNELANNCDPQNADAAKALLLLARWAHHTGQKQKGDVISIYSRVKELQPMWEKGYFYMAKYFDDLLADARKRQEENQEMRVSPAQVRNAAAAGAGPSIVDDKPWWNYLPDVVLFYAKTLHKGHRYLFQALPRLLTLWFDFGDAYRLDAAIGMNKDLRLVHSRVHSVMKGCLKDLPVYHWLASLSQLVSRICHPNQDVVCVVKSIIIAVLQAYPQQALWTMAAVSKSAVTARRDTASEILHCAKNAAQRDRDKALFVQFANFIEQMIRLSYAPVALKVRSMKLSTEFSYLKRMMPVDIILPVQRALTVALPADMLADSSYGPFPSADCVTISGIKEEVIVLASLQRPKKVVFIASDGTEHPFLCKPKDDLRKDARMMEFTAMINRLLSKDPTSRRRKLYIRTFAVLPLTEDCGMIEWVIHTRGFRLIVQDLYAACGRFGEKTNPMIKQIYEDHQKKISGSELLAKVLPMFPPVFHKWFLTSFPEPTAWFQARVAYAHTTAVWSMVGHIVGLGDRHGENILLDATTGDCVHVDFSCLFDKGLALERPELVPFRFTQNMVDGLGITGYEGVFLRVCEITLSVLRSHRETLMSILETFIHDPLVEWTKTHKMSGTEVKNPHAQRALANIEARLEGVVVGVGAAPSLPLSVEGQAHRLIAEAVSHDNLGSMFIWWMPWF